MTEHSDQGFARRPRGEGRWVAGVCSGLADRWDLPAGALRLAFLLAIPAFGAGVLLYAALLLAMPARGASAGRVARSAEIGRTLLTAGRMVAALLVLLAIGGLALALALFGLAAVSLLLACACVLALVLSPGLRPAPLGATAVALTLPAAAVALGDVQIARQFGPKTVELRTPGDVSADGYRAGAGPLLLDLRRFSAPSGSTTTIRARADLRSLVVALPRTRCLSITIDQTLDRRWPARILDLRREPQFDLGAPVRVPTTQELARVAAGQPASLIAYGKPVLGTTVRYTRTVPGAPRLHLDLTTGRSQAIVRDYPDDARPLASPFWPTPRVAGAPRYGIPEGVSAAQSVPDDPAVPALLRVIQSGHFFWGGRGRARGVGRGIVASLGIALSDQRRERLREFVTQELLLRAAVRYEQGYRERLAGPCASSRDRAVALGDASGLQAAGHAMVKLTTRWAVVQERWPAEHLHLRLVESRGFAPIGSTAQAVR